MTKQAIINHALAAVIGIGLFGCKMDDMAEPNPPTDLKVSELSGGAHLTWKDNSEDEGAFMLERKIGTAAFETYKSLDFNTTQYHDTDVKPATAYGYRVMAMPKSGGHSTSTKYSNEVTFMLGTAGGSGTGGSSGAGGAGVGGSTGAGGSGAGGAGGAAGSDAGMHHETGGAGGTAQTDSGTTPGTDGAKASKIEFAIMPTKMNKVTATGMFMVDGTNLMLMVELENCPAGKHPIQIHMAADCGMDGEAAGGGLGPR